MKAGLESAPGTYPWSSYPCYCGKNDGVTDSQMAEEMVGGQEALISFFHEKNDDHLLDISSRKCGVTEEEAKKIIWKTAHCKNVSEFQGIEKTRKRIIIAKLFEKGLSIRQISRLTGVSKSSVERCLQ